MQIDRVHFNLYIFLFFFPLPCSTDIIFIRSPILIAMIMGEAFPKRQRISISIKNGF